MIDLDNLIKEALKSQNMVHLNGLRSVKAKVNIKLTEAGRGGKPLADAEMEALIRREVKEREESNEFLKPGETEYEQNSQIIALLEQYLPKLLTGAEADAVIRQVLEQVKPAGPQELGKVMGALKATGKPLDMGYASKRAKELLQG